MAKVATVTTPHSWLTVISLFFVVFIAGCPPSDLFRGRFLIINNTGADLTKIALKVGDVTWNLPHTSAGQGWIRDLGSVAISEVEINWQTTHGNQFRFSIPFRQIVPNQCNDDLLVEITGPGTVETRLARVAQ